MHREKPARPALWETVTFAAFFATLPLYSPNLVFDPEFPGFETAMPYFANSLLASSLVAGLAVAFIAIRHVTVPLPRFAWTALLAVIYLAGFLLLFYLLLCPGPPTVPLGILAGTLCGVGSVSFCIRWAHLFSSFDLREAMLHLSILCAVGAVANTVFTFMSSYVLLGTFFLFVLTGLVSPLARSRSRESSIQAGAAEDTAAVTVGHERSSTPLPDEEGYASILRRLLSVILGPFIGFLLFALTMAVRKMFVFEVFYAESFGTVLAALVVIPLWFRRSEKPLLPFVYQVFLPIIAALLIILNSFPFESPVQAIGSVGIYVFFGIIGLLALASFNATANAREFSVPLIFGVALAAFSAVSIIGLRFRDMPFVSEHSDELLLVLSTLFFVYLVLSPGLKAWRSMFTPTTALSAHSIKEDLETRCEQLAQAGGLSPRESEIMLFIGRGYSPAFIAKKLVLSDSTVRSHVKNIYRKLGVNSREDLLQAIDDDRKRKGHKQ